MMALETYHVVFGFSSTLF